MPIFSYKCQMRLSQWQRRRSQFGSQVSVMIKSSIISKCCARDHCCQMNSLMLWMGTGNPSHHRPWCGQDKIWLLLLCACSSRTGARHACKSGLLLSLLKSLFPIFPLQLSSLWCCHHEHHRAVMSLPLLLSSLAVCEFLPLNALFIRIRVEAVTANLSKRKGKEGQANTSWCQLQE